MKYFEQAVDTVNGVVWSTPLVVILLLVGVFFSIKTRFMQVRHFKGMIKQAFNRTDSKEGISSFQAFSIALSNRIGVGNVAGVAVAIGIGGPGAIFWMWVLGFLGAATAYIESTLGQMYKISIDGQYRGGPAFYLYKSGYKWLAYIFAFVTLIGTGFLMPGVQSSVIADSFDKAFGVPNYIMGVIVAVVLSAIIFGGVKRIAKFAEVVVPFMAFAYLFVALIILVVKFDSIPYVFSTIFTSAFGTHPIFGGILGSAIMLGVKRGIYANEAGQGSGPHAASAAEVSHPAKQGLVQAASIYFDTFGICTASAFIILMMNTYTVVGNNGEIIHQGLTAASAGIGFTQDAFNMLIDGWGGGFVAIVVLMFAFTTIMAYYYMAEVNAAFLTYVGWKKESAKRMFLIVRILFVVSTFLGTIYESKTAWALGDSGVGMMAWINVVAMLLLFGPAVKLLKDYEQQAKEGKNPIYDPAKLGIKNNEFWEYRIHPEQKKFFGKKNKY